MTNRIFLLALLGIPLVGCVSVPKYVPLEPDSAKQVKSATAYLAVRQDEIIITAQSSNVSAAVGGGLIVAMIDSKIVADRQEGLQKQIEPLYDSIDDVDFRNMFWSALETQLRDKYKLQLTTIRKSPTVLAKQELDEIKLALKPDEGFMYVNTNYTFNTDFSALTVSTAIDVWRGGNPEPIFSNTMEYISAPVGSGGEDSIKKWTENSGKLYREKIAEGIAEIIKMARLDMERPRFPTPNGLSANLEKLAVNKQLGFGNTIQVLGEPLITESHRVILRNDAGRLVSVPY